MVSDSTMQGRECRGTAVPLVTMIPLVPAAAAAPASSVTVLIPTIVDRAAALENEGQERAARWSRVET